LSMEQAKILVIDDDEGMIELLSLLLAPASSQILTTSSGSRGIELVRQNDLDAIILDLMMPEMTGWMVCKSIREFSDVPILILTAMDSPGAIAQALDAGADDYLIKPVSSGTLIAHLNRLVRRRVITQSLNPAKAAGIA
jgi:DNA-binding response OmpR family regulator